MFAVVRSYSDQGAAALFDALEQRGAEIEDLISGVPGFVSYAAVRTPGGGVTVTLCEAKAGTDESSRRAAAWVAENIAVAVTPPTIAEGNTAVQFSA